MAITVTGSGVDIASVYQRRGKPTIQDGTTDAAQGIVPRGQLARVKKTRSVPVIIDSVRKDPDFPIVRCSFFTIENDMPSPDWRMTLSNYRVSFHLLGLSGVIWRPMKGMTFNNPAQINELFEIVERDPELHIGVLDIWFPDWLFDKHVRRGDVYRVTEDLFRMGYLFRRDRISKEEFLEYCHRFRDTLRISARETESFRRWSAMQIESAKGAYPKNRDLALKWHENEPPRTERGGNQE
jgi:hypothetical protein